VINRLREWIDPNRPLTGVQYALIGLGAFAVKYNCDRLLAWVGFNRSWYFWEYWQGANSLYLWNLRDQDARFFMAMLLCALPFIAFGILMTIRRLRTLMLPLWMSVIFFIPFVNLVFFGLLSMINKPIQPGIPMLDRPSQQGWGRYLPESAFGSAAVSTFLTALIVAGVVAINVVVFKKYGWGLFVLLPFVQGMLAAWTHGYHKLRTFAECQYVAFSSCVIAGVFLMMLALEGAICILMAAPIWIALASIGAWVGWGLQQVHWSQMKRTLMVLCSVAGVPFLMGMEYSCPLKVPLLEAKTTIDINAPREIVWKHVVEFSELPPPKEWVFKTGLSYPVRARIYGRGVGAMRHCEFSTGIFKEPIEVWDEPSLLRFSVINTPSPMEEMSLYSHIEPPHLKGYMISKRGQFHLTTLPDGQTRLEGTTWYEHHLWPASYWQLWSDQIIHRIHMRVLKHIKTLAESEQMKRGLHG
jgi:hypothetical protein